MRNLRDSVIIVNEKDEWLGTMEKLQAHVAGALHRAFSIFIFNNKGEMLLQKRAATKYHSGGLWTNACCSHPYPGESTISAAHRRLVEELGFDCNLEKAFSFRYKAQVDAGLIENEYDHCYTGVYNGPITPNPSEVDDHKFISLSEIEQHVKDSPKLFTPWFILALPKLTTDKTLPG